MYGFKRTNIPKPETENPSLGILRQRGLGLTAMPDNSVMVANAVRYWPKADFWRTADGKSSGYGIRSLLSAMPVAEQ